MNIHTDAIKAEMKQFCELEKIMEVKSEELNTVILSHLELSEELISDIQNDWISKGLFKREKNVQGTIEEVDSYCTKNFVREVLLRYCQNRGKFKKKFDIKDGNLLNINSEKL